MYINIIFLYECHHAALYLDSDVVECIMIKYIYIYVYVHIYIY